MEAARWDLMEPILPLAFEANHLSAFLWPAWTIECEIMVKQGDQINSNFFSLIDFPNGLDWVESNDGVWITGMTYWLPAMTISRPKFSPADPIIVLLDPLNHNYVLSGVFLFIYDLLGFNGASSINYWYIFLFIDSNSIFFSPVSLSFDSCLHDCLQKGLLGDVIVE